MDLEDISIEVHKMSLSQSKQPEIQISQLPSLPTEIQLHILFYVCPAIIRIIDMTHYKDPQAHKHPHRVSASFQSFLGALKTCTMFHSELSKTLYPHTTFYLHFDFYDPFRDQQTTTETNLLARLLRQIGHEKAASMTKLVLVFEHGCYDGEWDDGDPNYPEMYDMLELTLDLLRLHAPNLKELILGFADVRTSGEVPSGVLLGLQMMLDEGFLEGLERFMVEGLLKKGEWDEIRKLEKGVVRGEDDEVAEGTWGKEFADLEHQNYRRPVP